MPTYVDDYLDKIKDKIPYLSTQEILNGFYDYLKENVGEKLGEGEIK